VILFGCFEFLVSVLELFLVVVKRLYFRPWVGFVMLFSAVVLCRICFCSMFIL
jgi:hypothetical protein